MVMLLAAILLIQLIHAEESASSESTVDANDGASNVTKEKEKKKKGPKVFPEKQWYALYNCRDF